LSLGLEIGPLDKPIVKKSEGAVFYVDIASEEVLRQRYAKDDNVNAEKISSVDFVWDEDKPLRETIPASLTFDYVIASHVIEHSFDMIEWLKQVAAVVKPGGILSLAVPDKRFTFDREREPTTMDQLLKIHTDKNRGDGSSALGGHNQVFTFETFSEIIKTLCSDATVPFRIESLHQRAKSPFEFIAILKTCSPH
jgi:SAM-dependent methyltransferase